VAAWVACSENWACLGSFHSCAAAAILQVPLAEVIHAVEVLDSAAAGLVIVVVAAEEPN
jgi:hypothetical protein